MYYIYKTSVTCLASCSASKTDAGTHSKANETPFYLLLWKHSQWNTSLFLHQGPGNQFNQENAAPLHKDSAPKHSGTHLSFIPVCCLVHRHCWVNGCQLISVCLHPDPTVEPQRQEIVHNLKQSERRHWPCMAFMALFAAQHWLRKGTKDYFKYSLSAETHSVLGTKRQYYNWGSNRLRFGSYKHNKNHERLSKHDWWRAEEGH